MTVLWNTKPLRVVAYYATSVDLSIKPYDWYRELVVAGAREHQMPPEYIASSVRVAIVTDPDKERAARARKSLT